MAQQTFKVDGMSCGNCEAAVTEALQELGGISNITVSAPEGTANFTNDGAVAADKIVAAIEDAGFDVVR